eukprot:SAG31_NODE_1459_length_8254_cov_4.297854_4_plen_68_part_00
MFLLFLKFSRFSRFFLLYVGGSLAEVKLRREAQAANQVSLRDDDAKPWRSNAKKLSAKEHRSVQQVK